MQPLTITYVTAPGGVDHWCPLTRTRREILSLGEPGGLGRVSTLVAKDGWLVAGGLRGEVVLQRLTKVPAQPYHRTRLTTADNGITNYLDIDRSRSSGPLSLWASSNDCGVRCVNLDTLQISNTLFFPWAVNVSLNVFAVMSSLTQA